LIQLAAFLLMLNRWQIIWSPRFIALLCPRLQIGILVLIVWLEQDTRLHIS
jgi:hypothetical protein